MLNITLETAFGIRTAKCRFLLLVNVYDPSKYLCVCVCMCVTYRIPILKILLKQNLITCTTTCFNGSRFNIFIKLSSPFYSSRTSRTFMFPSYNKFIWEA